MNERVWKNGNAFHFYDNNLKNSEVDGDILATVLLLQTEEARKSRTVKAKGPKAKLLSRSNEQRCQINTY
jgi:hypothetical protein